MAFLYGTIVALILLSPAHTAHASGTFIPPPPPIQREPKTNNANLEPDRREGDGKKEREHESESQAPPTGSDRGYR